MRLEHQFPGSGRVRVAACPAQQHAERHETLLHAVVQIAFDPSPFVVHRLDHPGAAGGQFADTALQDFVFAPAGEAPGEVCVQRRHPVQALSAQEEQEQPAESGQQHSRGILDLREDEPAPCQERGVAGADGRGQQDDAAQQPDAAPRREIGEGGAPAGGHGRVGSVPGGHPSALPAGQPSGCDRHPARRAGTGAPARHGERPQTAREHEDQFGER